MDCQEIEEGTDADGRLRRPRRILRVMGPSVRTRLAIGLLIVGLLGAAPAEAQRFSCGGHRIHWVGGAPAASADPAGADRGRSSGAPGAIFDPKHEAGQQPTIDEPAGLNRERWDALVFDAHERHQFYSGEQTRVLDRATVPTIRICIQSSDTSNTGERLVPYSEASWWRQNIERWTGLPWNGEIRIAACTDEPQDGWLHVREGRPGEVLEGIDAHAKTMREGHPHRAGRWLWSEIVWSPNLTYVLGYIEQALAHELGHILGFNHVYGAGYVMGYVNEVTWPAEESSLAQLAYQVGPNIRYPGLVRAGAEVDPDQASPDRAALMALYNATDGSNWTDSTNWDTDEALDHWHGVRTDDAGRVVRLDLHVNNLTGSIPPELDTLINLERLRLYENNLTGRIPPELGTLINLEELKLDNNNLTGPIPAELGALTNLENLHLHGNDLTGSIPPELGDLTNLKLLWVAHNNLSGSIPPELGSFTNLTGLWAAGNNLTGPLPSSMINLGPLSHLHLENNAGLCAPADAAFQAWLARVKDFRGEICAQEVPTVPFLGQMLLALLLLCGGAYYRVRQVRHWAR